MRGIILANELGKQLWPMTIAVQKNLIPVYDKPMIYYPLSVLLLSGIRDILIISTPKWTPPLQSLLGGGEKWGINLSYALQSANVGPVYSFFVGSEFIGNQSTALILGDNLFYGYNLTNRLKHFAEIKKGARIFTYQSQSTYSEKYDILSFNKEAKIIDSESNQVKSNYTVTGLYFYDNTVLDRVRDLDFNDNTQLNITCLNNSYLDDELLYVKKMNSGIVWFDIGSYNSLFDAVKFVENIEKTQGKKIACPEEICWRMGYIDTERLLQLASELKKNNYARYLHLLTEK